MNELTDIIESWDILKRQGREFNRRDMHRFVAQMNAHTRRLVTLLRREDPQFFESLAELATNAATLTTKGARIIADGVNRTDA